MRLTRSLEERLVNLYRQTKVVGGLFRSLGQEADAVGSAFALERRDILSPLIRNLGSMLVKGAKPVEASTPAYQCGAQTPSVSRGPAGQDSIAGGRRYVETQARRGGQLPVGDLDDRAWQLIKSLSPVALLDHWRVEVLAWCRDKQAVQIMGSDLYPTLGPVKAVRVSLSEHFLDFISDGVRVGRLRLQL